jgi:hypothetical protein
VPAKVFPRKEKEHKKSRPFLLVILLFLFLPGTVASAGAAEPWWHLVTVAKPSVLQRGGEGTIVVIAENLGDASATACTKVAEGRGKYKNAACEEEGTSPEEKIYEKTPVVMTATLPAGVEVVKVEPVPGTPEPKVSFNQGSSSGLGAFEEKRFSGGGSVGLGPEQNNAFLHACSEPAPRQVRCVYQPGGKLIPEALSPEVLPYGALELGIAVRVAPGAASGGNSVEQIGGGQAPATQATRALPVGEAAAATPFGVQEKGFSIVPESEGGEVQAQAGSHPFQLTTTFALDQTSSALRPPALPKDVTFELPPGLVANAVAFARCGEGQFLAKNQEPTGGRGDECPQDTAVGVILLTVDEPVFGGVETIPVPVFNLVPHAGEPVRFGFFYGGIVVTIDFQLRTGSDYGATAEVRNITQIANFISESLTIWGVPGEQSHNVARGWPCLDGGFYNQGKPCPAGGETHPVPFLTLPTSCTNPFAASARGDAWPTKTDPAGLRFPASAQPGSEPASEYSLKDEFERPIGLTGCNQLPFAPFIEVAPDVQSASTSTGLKVDVKVPQEVSENAAGLASSSVKDITVALPAGVAVNPSGANGLEACSEGLVGFESSLGVNGFEELPSEPGTENPLFTPRLPGSAGAIEASETASLQPGVNFCATASKIATVEIHTPLIKHPLKGSVYLATQNQNPFGSLIAAYIVAEEPESGVVVKLPGKISLCQAAGETIAGERCGTAGQLVSTFENEPELPFEDAELHFFGGERAPLATPSRCGTYTTNAAFVPWSATLPGGTLSPKTATSEGDEAALTKTATSSFEIGSGPGGGACTYAGQALPFSPSLTGGSTNINAGSFSPLTTTIARADGQQNLQSVTLHFPPGLTGVLAGIPLCGEPQAGQGLCPAASQIGETTVAAGVGSDPVSVKGGKVFLTGPYNGAPFGLSIVNPVKAGPFDLEHDTSPADPGYTPSCDCVVVRAKIEIDPTTAALTVTTNESGPYARAGGIPNIIDGVPVQIQKVNVLINRQGFTFNPTNCNPTKITGSIGSDENASFPVEVPLQVTNCKNLNFTPKFTVSTSGKTSKANGASLTTKLEEPKNALGTQANIAKVKVELPKFLPSRLTTLQKACAAAQFESNPAACPAASKIGFATVHTPLLPVPLTGPAIFVSHGDEAFPSLTMVLQGYGVTIDLVGATFIKNGVTSTTFRTVPDQPFSTFELTLPQGKYSALAANGNLCAETTTKLVKKKVTVRTRGRKHTITRKVKETVASSLVMPSEFVAQNGAVLKQDSTVKVTGCPKPHKAKAAKKHKGKRGKKH